MSSARYALLVAFAVVIAACSALVDFSGLAPGGTHTEAGTATDGAATTTDAAPPAGDSGSSAEGGATTTCPPWVLPATCDPKFLSDPKNCCVAGRDCQGGDCNQGKCMPVTIVADATTDARQIAVAGNLLVWATGCTGVLRVVDKGGAGNRALPAGAHCTPTVAISGDTKTAFWIEYDGPFLNRTGIDGSGVAEIVAEVPVSSSKASFARLAVDSTRAYWAMASPPSVWSAPLDGKHVTPTAIAGATGVKETAQSPYGVAVNATHVYWADQGAATIKRRALSDLGTDKLADVFVAESGPHDLALDADNVYWLNTAGDIRARPLDGATSTAVLASLSAPGESIAVDDQYVYFTQYADLGSVGRVRKSGGAVEVLAPKQNYPYGLTQDCTSIYFTNQANFKTGSIVRVTK